VSLVLHTCTRHETYFSLISLLQGGSFNVMYIPAVLNTRPQTSSVFIRASYRESCLPSCHSFFSTTSRSPRVLLTVKKTSVRFSRWWTSTLLSSGMLHRVVWWKFSDVSEMLTCLHHQVLMMEAVSTSETSVQFYQTTKYNTPEESHLRVVVCWNE
jgi:hypothetical protein